jgi:hemoglobin
MRHLPFAIGQRERDAWMTQMTRALDTLDLAPVVRDTFLRYFEGASLAMMNRD